MSVAETVELVPTPRDQEGARLALLQIREAQVEGSGAESARLPSVEVSGVVYDGVLAVLRALSAGHAVAITESPEPDLEEEISTSEAARILRVSRPKFVDILEEGLIPFRMVGTHRRTLRGDVLAFRETMMRGPDPEAVKRRQVESLKRQARISNKAGAGY